jgi:uncharacterized protein (DUF1015 family)
VPDLQTFRALRYDTSAVPDLSTVLCPPYDVIDSAERERLARDPRNAVNVELPDNYDAAAATLSRWINEGTLRRDAQPLIYLYEQRYAAADGSEMAARGFFCRLRLEPYGPTSGVLPHEHTMTGPKEDRFRLMSAVKANLSPVLFLYEDGARGAAAGALLNRLIEAQPTVETIGPGGLLNRIWIADPADSDDARELMQIAAARPVTIADGHHRYETALRYRDEVGGGSSEFVLALMYEAISGGLALLPWHRVLSDVDGDQLLASSAEWYSIASSGSPEDVRAKVAATPGSIGLWTREGGAILHADRAKVAPLLPSSASETLRWLDVSVLSSTLSRMIGTSTEALAAQGRLTYLSDASAAVALVTTGKAVAAFLLRPTPIEDVMAVAASGEHMPAKSTFFYPKAATGIVFNPLTD